MAGNSASIAQYYASLGVKVDTKSLQRVDKLLKDIETKLSKFSYTNPLALSKFAVNQKALERALGTALDIAAKRVSFEIDRFTINEMALRGALSRAMNRTNVSAPVSVGSRESRVAGRAAAGGIGAYALASRAFLPVAALAAGGYGLSSLNQRNQQVVSAQLQSQAVVQQAGGTAAQGKQSFEYLKSEANRIGFNYLSASGDYNKLLSGLTGSGISVGASQKVFSGFAELARVNKLDRSAQNRLFRALSQVAGKGKLQSEELTGQIAEALPGGTALFAQAYQKQLAASGKGGGLTGQEAIAKLQADMKKGLVTSDILTYAGTAASERANKGGGLTAASTASQAEQDRYQNSITRLSEIASKSGVEEGFARIFRTLNDGLGQSDGLVQKLSEGFNEATKSFRILSLLPESFSRMLDGKDGFITRLIGEDEVKNWHTNIESIKASWETLKESLGKTEWADYLKTTLEEVNGLLSILNESLKLVTIAVNAPQAIKAIMDNPDLPLSEKARLTGEVFSKASGSMTPEDWNQKVIQAGQDTKLTARNKAMGSADGNYDYSKDNLGYGDIPYAPGQIAPTNNTVTVTVGDIILQGSGTNSSEISRELGDTLRKTLEDQFSGMSLQFAKVGR